jgi:hypothetical protein
MAFGFPQVLVSYSPLEPRHNVMAAAHGTGYYLGFPESEVLLDGIVVPIRLAPSDGVTGL